MANEKQKHEPKIVSVRIHADYHDAFQASELKNDPKAPEPRYLFEHLREFQHLRITDTKNNRCRSLPYSALGLGWE